MKKYLLVAMDESENSMAAVRSVADFFSPDHQITLFSVVQDTAAICEMYAPELTPHFLSERNAFCFLENKKRELLSEAHQKAMELLIRAGFKEHLITSRIEIVRKGIARDIIREAESGYSAIILGRRGMTAIKEFFLGSVSQKVVGAVKDISVFIAR